MISSSAAARCRSSRAAAARCCSSAAAVARCLLAAAAATSSALRKERLRILTYNIHAWRDGDHVDNLQRVADTCLAVDADVICLNEVLLIIF